MGRSGCRCATTAAHRRTSGRTTCWPRSRRVRRPVPELEPVAPLTDDGWDKVVAAAPEGARVAVAGASHIGPAGKRAAELARGLEPELAGRLERERSLELRRDIFRDNRKSRRGQVELVDVEEELVGVIAVGHAQGRGRAGAGAREAIGCRVGDDPVADEIEVEIVDHDSVVGIAGEGRLHRGIEGTRIRAADCGESRRGRNLRQAARVARDQVDLAVRPDDGGKFPAILNLGPYQKDKLWIPPPTLEEMFLRHYGDEAAGGGRAAS